MKEKELISVRLDAAIINHIDELKDGAPYRNRSTIINAILLMYVRCMYNNIERSANAIDNFIFNSINPLRYEPNK